MGHGLYPNLKMDIMMIYLNYKENCAQIHLAYW